MQDRTKGPVPPGHLAVLTMRRKHSRLGRRGSVFSNWKVAWCPLKNIKVVDAQKPEQRKTWWAIVSPSTWNANEASIEIEANKKGRFILATNDLDEKEYPDQRMLSEYKDQQAVEKGFRFLKDPWFMLDSVFLKKPSRVSALMMVMTLCLMVYNVAEYRLRESLKRDEETLPNQKGKAVTNPTVRWVFQLMEGINIIHFMNECGEVERTLITNIDALRAKILHLFGQTACKMYGLIPDMADGPLRM